METGYYKINGTKRVLYWDGEKWMKPTKDQQGKYGWVSNLEKQPRVKKYDSIDIYNIT